MSNTPLDASFQKCYLQGAAVCKQDLRNKLMFRPEKLEVPAYVAPNILLPTAFAVGGICLAFNLGTTAAKVGPIRSPHAGQGCSGSLQQHSSMHQHCQQ